MFSIGIIFFNMVDTTPLFLFISYFGVPEPRIDLGTAIQQHDALPVGYVAIISSHLRECAYVSFFPESTISLEFLFNN